MAAFVRFGRPLATADLLPRRRGHAFLSSIILDKVTDRRFDSTRIPMASEAHGTV
jgi:hypothetical protein